jgi:hypothetical protein
MTRENPVKPAVKDPPIKTQIRRFSKSVQNFDLWLVTSVEARTEAAAEAYGIIDLALKRAGKARTKDCMAWRSDQIRPSMGLKGRRVRLKKV